MAAINGKTRYILTSLEKIRGLRIVCYLWLVSLYSHCWPFTASRDFWRYVSLVQFIKQGFLGRTDTLLQSYFIKLPWENQVFSFTHSLTTFFPWSTTEQTHGNMDSFRFMQWTAERKKTDKLASPYRLIVPDWSFSGVICLQMSYTVIFQVTLTRYFSSLLLNSFLFDEGLDDSLRVE